MKTTKILAWLLLMVMVLSLCPTAALAEGEDGAIEPVGEISEPVSEPTVTEAPTEPTAEPETTEAPGEPVSEPTGTEAPTEPTAEPETTEAPSEPVSEPTGTEAPAEPTAEPTGTEAPAEPEVDEAVAAVEALIDALPDVDTASADDYDAAQDAADAFYALSEAQQAQVSNLAKLIALMEWFSAQVTPLAECSYENGFCVTDHGTGVCSAPFEPATKNDDGYYEIDNGGKLFWFASLVNGDGGYASEPSANAILTADIDLENRAWTPIGTSSKTYAGTFNGCNYTISKLDVNVTGKGSVYAGLFGVTNGGVIQNVTVSGSVSGSASGNNAYVFAGAIVGDASGSSTIQNCHSTAAVTASGSPCQTVCAGGIAGRVQSSSAIIQNCSAVADVTASRSENGSAAYVGGIVGKGTQIQSCFHNGKVSAANNGGVSCYAGGIAGQAGKLTNCYHTGALTCSGTATTNGLGGIVGNWDGVTRNFADCYYRSGDGATNGIGLDRGSSPSSVKGTAMTADAFRSGEVTYKLNGSTSDGTLVYYQTCGTGLPAFSGQTVYQVTGCSTDVVAYANSADATGAHSYANGFCVGCGAYESATQNGGVYEIYNAGQLYWFAEHVNSDYPNVSGKLMDNITVNTGSFDTSGNYTVDGEAATPRVWTPIGKGYYNQFKGTFDGNGKTVSGLYFNDMNERCAGLLGFVDGGTVKNVTVANSYFRGLNSKSDQISGIGGVVGHLESGSITGCSAAADVTVGSDGYCGGIVGFIRYGGTVSNCASAAAVCGTNMAEAGGVVGNNVGGTVSRCCSTGAVSSASDGTYTSARAGGVVGYNSSTVTDCYATGNVSGTQKGDIGGVVGENNGTVQNCYTTGTVTPAATGQSGPVIGDENKTTTNCYYQADSETDSLDGTTYKTAEQFKSGEVAYLLNGSKSEGTTESPLVWFQTCGVGLPAFSGKTVYYNDTLSKYYNTCTEHDWTDKNGICKTCGATCTHDWESGVCKTCGMICTHSGAPTDGKCTTCGQTIVATVTCDGHGTKGYTTFEAAVASFNSDSCPALPELKLYYANISFGETQTFTRAGKLYLNGCILNGNLVFNYDTYSAFAVYDDGTIQGDVTVQGKATLQLNGCSDTSKKQHVDGTLTVKGANATAHLWNSGAWVNTLVVETGTATVKVGSKADALTVKDGTVEVSNGTVTSATISGGTTNISGGTVSTAVVNGGAVNVSGGTVTSLRVQSADADVSLSGGTYQTIKVLTADGEMVKDSDMAEVLLYDLLAEGYAYSKGGAIQRWRDKNEIDCAPDTFTVVAHTHTYSSTGSCACGADCPHTNVEDGKCTTCHTPMGAMLEVTKNGTTNTYYGSTVGELIVQVMDLDLNRTNAAYKFTVLNDQEVGVTLTAEYGSTVTLDLNGHTLSDAGGLMLSGSENGTITITDSGTGGKIEKLVVLPNTYTVALQGGTYDTISIVDAEMEGVVAAEADRFVTDLLAAGYVYQSTGASTPMDSASLAEKRTLNNVEVVPCPHSLDASGACQYCGLTFAAKVTNLGATSYYTDLKDALDTVANGGTVTLLSNISQSNWSGSGQRKIDSDGRNFTLDLNGKTIYVKVDGRNAVAVRGLGELTIKDSSGGSGNIQDDLHVSTASVTIESGTFHCLSVACVTGATKSSLVLKGGSYDEIEFMSSGDKYSNVGELLASGYGYQRPKITSTGPTAWVTDLSVNSLQNVSVQLLPITGVSITPSKTDGIYTYGDTITLTANVTRPAGATGTVTYRWYKAKENGEATATIDGANEASYSPKNLAVGTYYYRVEATADNYTVSAYVTVTVKQASVTVSPQPTARTLTYTGEEQDLVTNGTATGGWINYSMDNSTDASWGAEIPARTDAGDYMVYWRECAQNSNYKADNTVHSIPVSIAPALLTASVTVNDKTYDGNTTATINSITFFGLVKGESLTEGMDYTVSAVFANANAGENKKVTVTVTLKNDNYTFEDSNGHNTDTFTTTVTADIKKKDVMATLTVADKEYDGRSTATVSATVPQEQLVPGDSINISGGLIGIFTDFTVGPGKNVTVIVDSSKMVITGTNSKNYNVKFPSKATGNIVNNWEPKENTEFTASEPNANGWLKEDLTVTAAEGYDLSLTGAAHGSWSPTLTGSDEGANSTLEFYVREKSSGRISKKVTLTYNLDKNTEATATTGSVEFVGRKDWQTFVNGITFGLFYKDGVTVKATAEDSISGVDKIEYAASDTAMSLDEVKAITNWTPMPTDGVGVTVADAKKFVYFIRVTDKAGNVTYFSTDGAVYDTTSPAITGIENGATYYTTQSVTVTDTNLKTVVLKSQVAGASVIASIYQSVADGASAFKLGGDKNATYTVTATDEAGNETVYTVTMKPISALTDAIDGITEADVTSANRTDIEAAKDAVERELENTDATAEEEQALTAARDNAEKLLERIDAAAAAAATENIQAVENITAENVKTKDKSALEAAKADLETALENFGSNYTEAEKAAIEAAIERIEAALKAIEQIERAAQMKKAAQTGDNAKPVLYIVVIVLALGAIVTIVVVRKKKQQ